MGLNLTIDFDSGWSCSWCFVSSLASLTMPCSCETCGWSLQPLNGVFLASNSQHEQSVSFGRQSSLWLITLLTSSWSFSQSCTNFLFAPFLFFRVSSRNFPAKGLKIFHILYMHVTRFRYYMYLIFNPETYWCPHHVWQYRCSFTVPEYQVWLVRQQMYMSWTLPLVVLSRKGLILVQLLCLGANNVRHCGFCVTDATFCRRCS